MTPVHRRAILRTLLGSAAAMPVVSLTPDAAKSQQPAFGAGFNLVEASDLLYMCDQLYSPPDGVLPPAGFTQRWGSAPLFEPVIAFPPLDELWSLWQNNSVPSTYAIIVRGTVGTSIGSVLEDLLSFLVQATGNVEVAGITIPYKFAADPNASVHAGFVLGTLLLLKVPVFGILAQLATRVPPGSNIYIAGHSQGAAVAALLSSYLHYDVGLKNNNYSYKIYTFAQPKPGDDHYDTDFGSVFCNKGLAFRLTNSLDFIPQLPFTWEVPTDLNYDSCEPNRSGVIAARHDECTTRGGHVYGREIKDPSAKHCAGARANPKPRGRSQRHIHHARRRLALFCRRRDGNCPDRNALHRTSMRSVLPTSYYDL
jgi:Lipase (class 3)